MGERGGNLDHLVRADRPREVQRGAVVDAGDVRAESLGGLDREGACPSAGAYSAKPPISASLSA
jgi:hypothetical protein